MATVKLYTGVEMLVSDEDEAFALSKKWYQGHDVYAKDRTGKYFHQYILGPAPSGMETDHINRDRLDNRRENLRFVSRQVNQRNKAKRNDNTSGLSGVIWNSNPKCLHWQASIWEFGKRRSLLTTRDFFEACCARKSAELRVYGVPT